MRSQPDTRARSSDSATRAFPSLALSLYFFAATASADGPAVKPLRIDDVLSEKATRSVAISPDGKWYAYSVCDPAEQQTRGWTHDTGCSAWVQQRGGQPQRISEGMGIELSWSPDSRHLTYQAYEDVELKVWVWSRDDRSKRKLSELRLAWFGQIPQPVQWTPDGRHVLVKYALSGGKYRAESKEIDAQLPLWARQPSEAKAKVRTTEAMLPPSSAESGNTSYISEVGLALVDVATGSHRVIHPAHDINGARLSPDGKKVAYTVRTSEMNELYGAWSWDVGVVDIASGRRQILAKDIFQYHGMNFSWSPDSKRVAFLSGPSEPEFIEERGVRGAQLTIASADGMVRQTYEGDLRMRLSGYWAPYWTCDSRAVFVTAEDGLWRADTKRTALEQVAALDGYRARNLVVGDGRGYSEPGYACGASATNVAVDLIARDVLKAQDVWVRVLRDGSIETSPLGFSVEDWSFHLALLTRGGERLLTMAQAVDKPMEIVEFDRKGAANTLTSFNHALTGYRYGTLRMIEFQGPSGKLKGAVLLPPDFREGKRYPTVLEMYPGWPMSGHASRTFGLGGLPMSNAQMLATRGYITMVFDSETHEGTLSKDILDSVNAAADELIRRGWADPKRLAMRGCSHAGYAVLATVMQTDRFKAGIAECAFGDLGNFWGFNWKHFIQYGIGKLMVPPWKDPMRYVEHSPYYHADKINTPLMLVVGSKDVGFVEQSEQLHRALDEIGREAVFVSYEGEGHGLRRPENVKDFWERLLAFLDAKLMRN